MKRLVASDAARMLARLLPSEQRPDQPLLVLGQLQRLGGAGVAALGHRVQLAAARRGERRLRAGEERRADQEHHDPRSRSPRGSAAAKPRSGGPLRSPFGDGWPELCGQGVSASRARRRLPPADASPVPAAAAAPRAHGCRSRSWRCWRGRAASGSPCRSAPLREQMRREGVAQRVRRHRCGVEPGHRAKSLTNRKNRSRVMCPRRPRAGKRNGERGRGGPSWPRSRCASQAASASRAGGDSGTIRSRPPLPRTRIIRGSPRAAATGSDTSSLTRSPVA